MKPSVLHIVLAFALLLSYGAERLLPCAGIWDIDCQDTPVEAICEADHADDSNGRADHGHSHDSESSDNHGDHQCGCPCHTVAITSVAETASTAIERPHLLGTYHRSLPCVPLSPPDHIPIG